MAARSWTFADRGGGIPCWGTRRTQPQTPTNQRRTDMPRQPTGTIFKTQHGYGIRWPENGKKPSALRLFRHREDARAWRDVDVGSDLARGVTRREGWCRCQGRHRARARKGAADVRAAARHLLQNQDQRLGRAVARERQRPHSLAFEPRPRRARWFDENVSPAAGSRRTIRRTSRFDDILRRCSSSATRRVPSGRADTLEERLAPARRDVR